MIEKKIYLYDSSQEQNGYRGQDFSSHILQGNEEKEDITQELDTAEITLCGLSFSNEFAPETKFILDTWEDGVLIESATRHFCVARDLVRQPILSDNNYFDHHISFIEPSVIAQKRLVDNISTTYKLKDVTLKEVPAYPDVETIINLEPNTIDVGESFKSTLVSQSGVGYRIYKNILGKRFELDGDLKFRTPRGEIVTTLYNNIERFATGDSSNPYMATFIIPKMKILVGRENGYVHLGNASLSCVINEYDVNGENPSPNPIRHDIISNSIMNGNRNVYQGVHDVIDNSWLLESVVGDNDIPDLSCAYYKKYTTSALGAEDPVYEISVPLKVDKKYTLTISLYQFPDNIPVDVDWIRKFTGNQPSYYVSCHTAGYQFVPESAYNFVGDSGIPEYLPSTRYMIAQNTSGSANLITFGVSSGTIVYNSSTPYSALSLLQKAIINSSIYEKEDGVYIADVNNSNLPFYIDDEYIDELEATVIIENFYNQKNLWEIMIEVGNYIHAIPELRFGADDKFLITFNRLGRTDEKTDPNNTKVSIYNSRSIEDYICATSSYVTNMVQLGGVIEEWVVPKTTNEQLLVSNDTAEIVVSKPIIELLEIVIKENSSGRMVDFTNFVYEENVYKTLRIDKELIPNRGIAMFYRLGTNVITGGDYQLPQANTNIFTDYTFKKVIWCAFYNYEQALANPSGVNWGDIKVKDYSFFIRYRTKDSVRQNHIRPDLRKYLLNTKYDKFPEHNQFNNQTDVVVDSLKFGNNMYGKLIKTGNNSYSKIEWNDKYKDLKHKGELYRLNGELFYVAKVTHYYFCSYILSDIKFSKDYNELSAVIGIPSEPRFFEISEQSLIWREFAINDILLLTDNREQLQYQSNYVFNFNHLSKLILGEGTDFAKYAITVFKGDKDNSRYDQTVGEANLYKEILTPINAYSSENTLTYEWDMADNYSAGDKVVSTENENYNSLRAVSYTDIYGKSALLDFYILGNIGDLGASPQIVKNFPESPISTKMGDERPFVGDYDILGTNVKEYDDNFNSRGIGLLKDCREALSVNFNLQLATNSDTFVLSPYIYLPNKTNVKIVLLAEEVNKLSGGYINNSAIITPKNKDGEDMTPYFDFSITKNIQTNSWDNTKVVVKDFGINFSQVFENVADEHFTETQGYQRVKSIVVLCDVPFNAGVDTGVTILPYKTQFVFARNIPKFWDREKALSPVYFGSPNKATLFTNKQ